MRHVVSIAAMLLAVILMMTATSCELFDAFDSGETYDSSQPQPTTPATSNGNIGMTMANWEKVNTGEWEQTTDGIKVYGAGYREGHQGLLSKTGYDFRGKETRIKWLGNGGDGNYSAFWVFLVSDYDAATAAYSSIARGGYFTTDHSYLNSVLINADMWYYTRITVDANGGFTAVTATADYDDNGGSVIYSGSGEYADAAEGNILVIFNDNYGGTATYVQVGEARVGSASAAASEPAEETQVLEEQPAGPKTIYIYPQPGISNATINGIPVVSGRENTLQIDPNLPLTAKYSYPNTMGSLTETSQQLDTYYIYHVLKENGGWASTVHKGAYETDKSSP